MALGFWRSFGFVYGLGVCFIIFMDFTTPERSVNGHCTQTSFHIFT